MSAAEDIHAGYPEPFTGRAAPPESVSADNDDAITQARERRRDAIRVKPKARGRQKRLARVTGMSGPERAMHKAHEALKQRNKAVALQNADARGNKAKIAEHIAKAVKLEDEAKAIMQAHEEGQWIDATNEETATLAEGRGERVRRFHGRVIVSSRCGLTMAYEDGKLDSNASKLCAEELFNAGRRYRDAYEISMGMTSSRGEGGSGAKGPQVRKIEAGQDLDMLRAGLSAQQARTLDAICGESQTLATWAKACRIHFDEAQDQLIRGLETAAVNIRAAKAVKDTKERLTKDRLQAAHVEIEAAMRAVA